MISGYRGALVKSFQEEILIPDRIPNAGPLGGLEACFQASARPYALVLPVDMPTVTVSLLASLISGFRRYIKEECSAGKRPDIMILSHGGKEEPLAAIYPTELAALAREQILSKDRSVMGFMKAAGYRTLDVPDLEDAFVTVSYTHLQKEIAKTAIDMLSQMMSGQQPENVDFDTVLIERESTL